MMTKMYGAAMKACGASSRTKRCEIKLIMFTYHACLQYLANIQCINFLIKSVVTFIRGFSKCSMRGGVTKIFKQLQPYSIVIVDKVTKISK